MRRSFLRYTRTFLLPLLALGLVLTGCDSSGSNGNNDDNDSNATSYSESGSYADEVAVNILAFDLGVRTGSNGVSNNSESDLIDLYEGNSLGGQTLPSGLSGSPEQGTYGDIATVNVSSLVSTGDLALSDQLEPADTPSDDGSTINTDELLRYYFGEASANDVAVTANGIVISQFAEKMLLGTPIYGEGAEILNDFANGNVSSNQAEQWDAAFGYFGFPQTLEPFLDYSTGEGLAGGPAQDLDDNGSIDLESEYAYTWAQYAIERSATAETNGQPNDFARRAFEALVQGRKDIENGEDPSDHAQTALDAWEATVAVNVIHYINAMESGLSDLDDDKTIAEGDIDEGAWGEAKAFAWNLQFYSDKLDDLDDVLEDIGNDPPYGEMEVSDYEDDLADATETIADAYDFNSSNVENW
jgi:hypothetical protein